MVVVVVAVVASEEVEALEVEALEVAHPGEKAQEAPVALRARLAQGLKVPHGAANQRVSHHPRQPELT